MTREERHCAQRDDRRYIGRRWLFVLRPVLRYSDSDTRDAFVPRGIGSSRGPVLRADVRGHRERPFERFTPPAQVSVASR